MLWLPRAFCKRVARPHRAPPPLAEPRHVPLSFRPARVARDEEFDETVFDRAARAVEPPDDDPEGEEAPAREGLPSSYRMRHDAHYVEELVSRNRASHVGRIPTAEADSPTNGHRVPEAVAALPMAKACAVALSAPRTPPSTCRCTDARSHDRRGLDLHPDSLCLAGHGGGYSFPGDNHGANEAAVSVWHTSFGLVRRRRPDSRS